MGRTTKLQGLYVDLRNDLLEEIDLTEIRIIKPAIQAKEGIQPLKKVIKKRGDRKVGAGYLYQIPKYLMTFLAWFRKVPNPRGYLEEKDKTVGPR